MATTINTTENTVSVTSAEHDITVTNNNTGTSVNVNSSQATSVTVGATGPKGATGPQGAPGSVEDTITADNILQPFNHITASGNISASGAGLHILGGDLAVYGRIKSHGSLVEIGAGHITASGNISSSGTIIANSFTGDGSGLTGVTSYTDSDTQDFINSINIISSSAQIASDISGSFINLSSSIETRFVTIEAGSTNKTLLSGSAQIATEISGAFIATSASLASDIATNLSRNTSNTDNISTNTTKITSLTAATSSYALTSKISGSLGPNGTLIRSLTATSISGSFTNASASFSTRVTANDAKVGYADSLVKTKLNTEGVISSSAQIASDISGSFVEASASFSTRVTANDAKVGYADSLVKTKLNTEGVISGSSQVSLSGFDTDNLSEGSSNLYYTDARVKTKLNSENVISASAQIATEISGALGANATLIRSLTATSISGSFVAPSSSFSTRVSTLEGNVGQAVNTNSDVTFATISATSLTVTSITSSIVTSSILQTEGSNIFGDAASDSHTFNGNITASNNISASGNLILSQSLTFGEASNLNNPNFIESNHLKIGAGGNDFAKFTDNYVQIFADGSNVFQVTGGSQKTIGLNANALDVDVTINTDGANAFQSVGSNDIVRIGGTTNHYQTASIVEHNAITKFQQGVTINNPNFNSGTGSAGLIISGSGGHIYTTGHITASGNISASGNIVANDATFAGTVTANGTTLTGDQDLSTYALISSISGSLGSNATLIRSLTATSISESFVAPSSSFSTRVSTLETNNTNTNTGDQNISNLAVTGSDVIFGNITASGNISASATITANAFVGDGSGLTGLTAAAITSTANGANNRIATYTDTDSLNGEANLTFDGTSLDVTGNITASGAISASGTIQASSFIGTATSASRADAANKVYTSQDNSNAEHFVTFVDSNNTVHADEDVHTTNFLRVNPLRRELIVEGRISVPGSSITFESGSISASRDIFTPNITASGTISSSGDIHSATIRYVANIHDANNAAMISGTSTALTLGDVANASNRTKITINDSARQFAFTSDETTEQTYQMPGIVTTNMIRTKNLRGQSPLIIDPTSVIISASQQFALGVGGTTSSLFLTSSITSSTGTPRIGFNTREPQTDFDVSAKEVQFQRPGERKGLKINDEGNIESFDKSSASAATGSEFILNYSRGVTIDAQSMVAAGFGPFPAIEGDAAAQTLFDGFDTGKQNATLEKLEALGFISPPQLGDTLGSIRWVAQSGSSGDFDARTTGEAAAIVAKVSEGDASGVSADLIFSVASKEGASGQKMLLDSNGAHEMTGSLSLGGNLVAHGNVSATGDVTAGDDLFVGDDIELTSDASKIKFGADGDTSITHVHNAGFLINANRYLSFRDAAVRINSGDDGYLDLHADTAIRSNGNLIPDTDDTNTLGTETHRWNDVFSVSTTTGGVFEVGLRTKDIGKLETGTIVSWKDGKCIPCCKSEDNMVMGVIKQGKDEPIVLGAEPVLVTGKVEEGDYIVTSEVVGHGKAAKEGYIFKKNLFGKVIAQALESAEGDSSLIKCMIRKM